MTFLSVNVNKFALIRNARDADLPNLYNISKKCIEYGADGITVHPRPDERHAKFSDLEILKNLTNEFDNIEFNIEGYPSNEFIQKVIEVMPDQVTLVPDPPEALTSSFSLSSLRYFIMSIPFVYFCFVELTFDTCSLDLFNLNYIKLDGNVGCMVNGCLLYTSPSPRD